MGGWVGSKAGLDSVEEKNFQTRRESYHYHPIVQYSLI
jgi:hypothetical protein